MLSAGHFASHRDNTKRKKYTDEARLAGAKFFPLVLRTLGTMGPSLKKNLRKIQFEFFMNSHNSDPDIGREMKNKLIFMSNENFLCAVEGLIQAYAIKNQQGAAGTK